MSPDVKQISVQFQTAVWTQGRYIDGYRLTFADSSTQAVRIDTIVRYNLHGKTSTETDTIHVGQAQDVLQSVMDDVATFLMAAQIVHLFPQQPEDFNPAIPAEIVRTIVAFQHNVQDKHDMSIDNVQRGFLNYESLQKSVAVFSNATGRKITDNMVVEAEKMLSVVYRTNQWVPVTAGSDCLIEAFNNAVRHEQTFEVTDGLQTKEVAVRAMLASGRFSSRMN